MKKLILNPLQAKAFQDGASKLIMVVDDDALEAVKVLNNIGGSASSKMDELMLPEFLPYQPNDKVWIAEEWETAIRRKSDNTGNEYYTIYQSYVS